MPHEKLGSFTALFAVIFSYISPDPEFRLGIARLRI